MERDEMTENDVDFSFLDRPEILRIGFYPRAIVGKKQYFKAVEEFVRTHV